MVRGKGKIKEKREEGGGLRGRERKREGRAIENGGKERNRR